MNFDYLVFCRNPLHYGMALALIVFGPGLGLGQLALALSVLALLTSLDVFPIN